MWTVIMWTVIIGAAGAAHLLRRSARLRRRRQHPKYRQRWRLEDE
jgi:hypothetical protein